MTLPIIQMYKDAWNEAIVYCTQSLFSVMIAFNEPLLSSIRHLRASVSWAIHIFHQSPFHMYRIVPAVHKVFSNVCIIRSDFCAPEISFFLNANVLVYEKMKTRKKVSLSVRFTIEFHVQSCIIRHSIWKINGWSCFIRISEALKALVRKCLKTISWNRIPRHYRLSPYITFYS